jgi:hypothetical protein
VSRLDIAGLANSSLPDLQMTVIRRKRPSSRTAQTYPP